jgi:DNA-binding CsgD family transcriptional regulator
MTVANTVNATDVRIGQCMRDMIEFVMRHASSSAARSLGLSGIDFFNWPDVARVAPGPYLLQQSGKPFTRKEFARQFAEARDAIPELKGLTLHGLRATAVINLRRAGLSFAQIGDIVGMGAKMVEHYCRNADMRSNSRAALTHLERAMAR